MLTPLDRLHLLLRPPGRGIPIIATGSGYAAPLLHSQYGSHEISNVAAAWKKSLEGIVDTRTILLGIPSDTGAGMIRGSSFGPLGIRYAYLHLQDACGEGLLDAGDVICVPQLLHDDMLNPSQIAAVQLALFGTTDEPLPVSPLSNFAIRDREHPRVERPSEDHRRATPRRPRECSRQSRLRSRAAPFCRRPSIRQRQLFRGSRSKRYSRVPCSRARS